MKLGDMKLNVGSGQFPQQGWVNIEGNLETGLEFGADVIVPFDDPPFRLESFDAIYCGHVLEHIHWEKVVPFLEKLWHLLKPGGRICVVGPDLLRARAGGYHDELIHRCYGDPALDDGTGWPHLWTCTERSVVELLSQVFVQVKPVDIRDLDLQWPAVNHDWWQCAVTASKQARSAPTCRGRR